MEIFWALLIGGFVLAVIVGEGYALAKGKTTLSRATWNLTKAWPPLPLLVGAVIGFLASHFWWGGHFSCY